MISEIHMHSTEILHDPPSLGRWRRSSRCAGTNACVEVRIGVEEVRLRDRRLAPELVISRDGWTALADLVCRQTGSPRHKLTTGVVEVRREPSGNVMVSLISDSSRSLHYDQAEWQAFLDGVANGDFAAP
jgi:Domain of unknown function (DUF397)